MADILETKFISTLSHKLKTPLNAILGFSELLLEQVYGQLNEKQIHYLKNIRSSGENLLTLLNDLIDLMNLRWGKGQLNYSNFSLPHALNQASESVSHWARGKNISLTVKNGKGISMIRADEVKFMKILHHLLSNAIKFTPSSGKVEISTRIIKHLPGGHHSSLLPHSYIQVTVADDGIGINPDQQEKIFSEFYQINPDRSRDFEGTGLGLCIARELVKLHHGKIWLESEENKGSKFYFAIPQLINNKD